MCLVVIVAKVILGGIFCGKIDFQGWVMGFCISGFTFLRCLVGVFGV